MKSKNRGVAAIIDYLVHYSGTLVLVLALAFGVFGDRNDHSRLVLVSCVLAGAGVGLLAMDIKLRVSAQRVDTLEQELRSLRDRLVADEVQSIRERNG